LTGAPDAGSARALSEYRTTEYQTTNDELRSKYTVLQPGETGYEYQQELRAEVAERVVEIDKTMAASRLTAPVRVERIVRHGAQVFGEDVWYGDIVNQDDFDHGFDRWFAGERPDLTGLRWRDAGYASTSANPAKIEEFGGRWRQSNSEYDGEPIVMHIDAPAGVGAIQLSDMDYEAELLLARGLTYEVIADHGVGEDGYRRIDVKVVPDE
jgi:hypothetical protein